MAGERTMWLVWNDDQIHSYVETSRMEAKRNAIRFEMFRGWAAMKAANWRCTQITVKEADDE